MKPKTRTLQAAHLISNYLGPNQPRYSSAFASLKALRVRLESNPATFDSNHTLFSIQLREAIRTEFFKIPDGDVPPSILCNLVTQVEALINGFDAAKHSCVFPGARVLVPVKGSTLVPGTLLHTRYGVVDGVLTSESFLHLEGANGGSFKWALTPSLSPITLSNSAPAQQPPKLHYSVTRSLKRKLSAPPPRPKKKPIVAAPLSKPSFSYPECVPPSSSSSSKTGSSVEKPTRILSADPSPPQPVLFNDKTAKPAASGPPRVVQKQSTPIRPAPVEKQPEKDISKSSGSPNPKKDLVFSLPTTPVSVKPSSQNTSPSAKRASSARTAKTVAIQALKATTDEIPDAGNSSDTLSDRSLATMTQPEKSKPSNMPVEPAKQDSPPKEKSIRADSDAIKITQIISHYLGPLAGAKHSFAFASLGALLNRLRNLPCVYDRNKDLLRQQVREAIRTELFKVVYPAPPHQALLFLVTRTETLLTQDPSMIRSAFFPGTRVTVPTEANNFRLATTLEIRYRVHQGNKVSESFLHLDGPRGGSFHWVFTAALRRITFQNPPKIAPKFFQPGHSKENMNNTVASQNSRGYTKIASAPVPGNAEKISRPSRETSGIATSIKKSGNAENVNEKEIMSNAAVANTPEEDALGDKSWRRWQTKGVQSS